VPGFDLFRRRRDGYAPRTPAGALKAIGAGLLPVEDFVYASTSVKPLDEEPFDLDAIERMLARSDLGIETATQLKSILEKLIGTDDQEAALFGAEGINALEGRYVNRIEELKSGVRKGSGKDAVRDAGKPAPTPPVLRELARQYRDLAALHARGSSIRAFYLRAAFHSLRDAFLRAGVGRMSRADLALMTDILLALGLGAQADILLGEVRASDDLLVLALEARVAFHRGRYARVAECCRMLAPHSEALSPRLRKAVAFWAGDTDG
jgi:hypothetical protein